MPSGGSSNTARCWVPGCVNSKISEKLNSSVKLFKFPSGDLARCRQWVKVLGSEKLLSCSPSQLKYKAVCEVHFRDYEIRRGNVKTTLVTSAIPSRFPSGVFPLPDEVVEQWPLQKENQSGGQLDSSVFHSRQPLAVSTPCPLKERETNVTHKESATGVQAGSSPQVASFEPDSGSKEPAKCHLEDDSSDDDWQLIERVFFRRKKDSKVISLPAMIRVQSGHKVVIVQ